jgi:hypothetical protein
MFSVHLVSVDVDELQSVSSLQLDRIQNFMPMLLLLALLNWGVVFVAGVDSEE